MRQIDFQGKKLFDFLDSEAESLLQLMQSTIFRILFEVPVLGHLYLGLDSSDLRALPVREFYSFCKLIASFAPD